MREFFYKWCMKFLYPKYLPDSHKKISIYKHNDQSIQSVNVTHDFGVGFTSVNMEDLQDVEFVEAYKVSRSNSLYGYSEKFIYRDYIVAQVARNAMSLDGAYLLIGVSWGCAAQLILEYCKPKNKKIYLVDGWDQSQNPTSQNVETYCGDYTFIEKKFGSLENVAIIRGLAPEVLDFIKNEEYAFVHISIDFNQAEVDSILKIYKQCLKGAYILIDCYGTNNNGKGWTKEAKSKIKALGAVIIPLLNGQGLIIKT